MSNIEDLATGFVAMPHYSEFVEEDLRSVVKVPLLLEESGPDRDGATVFATASSRGIFIDFTAFPDRFDSRKADRDCEILRGLIASHSNRLDELVQLVRRAGDREGAAKAKALLEEIGLTERSFTALGGGWLWLLVLLAAGCAGWHPYVIPDKPPQKK